VTWVGYLPGPVSELGPEREHAVDQHDAGGEQPQPASDNAGKAADLDKKSLVQQNCDR
jgi:hypothetical protein